MSLSFPASPTNGQQYQNWVWSSSVGAWQPNFAAGFVTSFNGRGGAVTLQNSDLLPGGKVLLMSSVVAPASPVAVVNQFYNFTNQYDVYELEIYDVQMSASAGLQVRVSYDGSTFSAGATDYTFTAVYAANGTTMSVAGSASGNWFPSIASQASGVPQLISACRAWFTAPWTTDRQKYFQVENHSYNGGLYWQSIAACTSSTSPLKGIQHIPSAGNITRGVFNLYGIVKAGAGGS